MPDVYADITKVDPELLDTIADALEVRSADPQQVEMRNRYFSWLELPEKPIILEAGCGSGPIARHLASVAKSGTVVGLDPSPRFIERAKKLAEGTSALDFCEGDARDMPFDDESFDAVVFHTCLCHVPNAGKAIAEAYRVLRPGGRIAIFDGDYSTTSFSIGPHDPLQKCGDAMINAFVHDVWLPRRLPSLVREQGFVVNRIDSHGYIQNEEPNYSFSIIDRGADALVSAGQIDNDMATAMKHEARRRADAGEFYGFINFVTLIAARP